MLCLPSFSVASGLLMRVISVNAPFAVTSRLARLVFITTTLVRLVFALKSTLFSGRISSSVPATKRLARFGKN